MRRDIDVGDRTVVERLDPLVGTVLDRRFRIDFQLAAGGFGAIYHGTDLETGAEIALKVLHPRLVSDPKVVARFRREGAVLVRLRDPHTITAYQLGEADDGTLYIVLELLAGESLHERFRARGPLPWQRVLAIGRAVCSSLAEAHAIGVVHRDLKPANIHLERRGADEDFVKVLDFGIAKIVRGADLTQAGQMIGTFEYMSPEQMVGGEITGRSDLYTLGVVMYEMISGKLTYPDTTGPAMLLGQILTEAPAPLASRIPVPVEVERIVMRCLEREPGNRYEDVHDLAAAIDRALAPGDDLAVTRVMPAIDLADEPTTIAPIAVRPSAPVFHPRPSPIPDMRYMPRFALGTSPVANVRRASSPGYDLSGDASRDVLVRRLVWAILLLIAALVALFASR